MIGPRLRRFEVSPGDTYMSGGNLERTLFMGEGADAPMMIEVIALIIVITITGQPRPHQNPQ